MIKVSDLRRVKKYCFDKIVQQSSARKDLAVKFKPISADMYECIMCNGEDYARLVADTTSLVAMPEIQISWVDFARICDLFNNTVELTVKDYTITFKEGKTNFKCIMFASDLNDRVNFKFDFENAIQINMRENLFILPDLGTFNKFCLSGNHIISTDGSMAAINRLDKSLGDGEYTFTTVFPVGTWFFNPNNKVIVSEDKRMATTIKQALEGYPTQVLLNLSQQALSNWFEVDVKEFLSCLERCAKIDSKVILRFDQEGFLNIKAENNEYADFATMIECKLDHPSRKQEIRVLQKYIIEFCRCAKEDKLKIFFDESPNEYKLKSEADNLTIFAMALRLPANKLKE